MLFLGNYPLGVSWGNHKAHFVWLLSLKNHCPALPNIQFLETIIFKFSSFSLHMCSFCVKLPTDVLFCCMFYVCLITWQMLFREGIRSFDTSTYKKLMLCILVSYIYVFIFFFMTFSKSRGFSSSICWLMSYFISKWIQLNQPLLWDGLVMLFNHQD